MIKKALPVIAIGITVVAAVLAYKYNRDEKMLKTLKTNGNANTTGMTDAQKKHWDSL